MTLGAVGFFSIPTVATATAVSLGTSCVFMPLTTVICGVTGAIQGAIGFYALEALGYSTCSLLTAASVGAVAGAAIAAPFTLLVGLKWVFESKSEEGDEQSTAGHILGFSLRIGIMFLASFILATACFLGLMPAVAVGIGAVATEVGKETLKAGVSCVVG